MATPFLRSLSSNQALRSRLRAAASGSSSSNDHRNDLIKKVLFELPPRPPITRSEEDTIRHNTITAAYKLHLTRQREERQAGLSRKFRMIQKAMDELETTNKKLYNAARTKERGILFPRQIRMATDTPAVSGWQYSYSGPAKTTRKKAGKS
ncbi:hypothetical protein BZG36_01818 [Bifiguratus adelaidae]|uniref:Large ribosomal subunit protein mL40 n=1 Tax=Bifiguratus adelaidae TaxID=1938954 RepID=A0A261Y251_9FUNG|nr:hypothetical protein BZG36_01818 [Bifiguratus adelaidae]